VIAHIGPVPLEEALPLVGSVGTALLLGRAWMALHLLRGRQRGT
jgi:hypothetical protein